MAGCVDWTKTLRRASFRGASFWVSNDDIQVGRRLVVHEFPNRDRPYVEDLGEKAIEFSVTAYIASDAMLNEKNALVSACRQRGPGTLVLPTEGSQRVRCKSCRRTFTLDRMGYIGFQLEFVEAGSGLLALPIPLLAQLVLTAATDAIPSIRGAFVNAFDTIRAEAWVVSSAVASLQGWAERFDQVRLGTRLEPAYSSTVARAVEQLHADAPYLMIDGADRVALQQTSLGLSSLTPNNGLVVDRIQSLVSDFREGATDPLYAFEGLEQLARWAMDEKPVQSWGLAGAQDERNIQAFDSMVRQLSLAHLAVAAADAEWRTRDRGIYARATVSELFERELHAAAAGSELFYRLDEVRGRAAEALSKNIIDAPPVVTIEAPSVMPSLVWAYRLTGDANGAKDLATLNKLAHPGFVPTEFLAQVAVEKEE